VSSAALPNSKAKNRQTPTFAAAVPLNREYDAIAEAVIE
jgi:hypothetical protein